MDIFSSLLQPTFWIQPVFYAMHGWLATEMAIWLLFHPYHPIFLPGTKIQLPFTPGIFPRGRYQLSQAISETVTDLLLTEADIQKQTQALITQKHLQVGVDHAVEALYAVWQNPQCVKTLYKSVRKYSETHGAAFALMLSHHLEGLETHLLKPFLSTCLSQRTLTVKQAETVSLWLANTYLTPQHILAFLSEHLTDNLIAETEAQIKANLSGLSGFVLQFVDLKKPMTMFRAYMHQNPEAAQAVIAGIFAEVDLNGQIETALCRLNWQDLSPETQGSLLDILSQLVRQAVEDTLDNRAWEKAPLQFIFRHTQPYDWLTRLGPLKPIVCQWLGKTLSQYWPTVLSYCLPILDIKGIIRDKIDQFSAQELEATIHRVCKRELRWLAFLGAFLGFWLGLISNGLTALKLF